MTKSSRPTAKKPPRAILGGKNAMREEIGEAMADALQPRSLLERRRATELATIEMELTQHRRMRDARLNADACELAEKYVLTWSFAPTQVDIPEELSDQVKAFLFGEEIEQQSAARSLKLEDVDPNEFLARAYAAHRESFAEHEKRIEALEKRRRELLDDFETLRIMAPRMRING